MARFASTLTEAEIKPLIGLTLEELNAADGGGMALDWSGAYPALEQRADGVLVVTGVVDADNHDGWLIVDDMYAVADAAA